MHVNATRVTVKLQIQMYILPSDNCHFSCGMQYTGVQSVGLGHQDRHGSESLLASTVKPLNKVHIEIFRFVLYGEAVLVVGRLSVTTQSLHIPIIGIQCIHVHSELSDQT